MTDKEKRKAVEDLGKWFVKRGISPDDGMPILAAMMCVGCVSIGAAAGEDLKATATRVEAAGRLVLETFRDWLEHPKGGWLNKD